MGLGEIEEEEGELPIACLKLKGNGTQARREGK